MAHTAHRGPRRPTTLGDRPCACKLNSRMLTLTTRRPFNWRQKIALAALGSMTLARFFSLTHPAGPLTAAAPGMPCAQLRALAGRLVIHACAQSGTGSPPERPQGALRARGNGVAALARLFAPGTSTAAVELACLPTSADTGCEFLRRHPAAVSLPRKIFPTSRGLCPHFGLAENSRGPSAACSPMPRSPSASHRPAALTASAAISGQQAPARNARAAVFTATVCTTPQPGRLLRVLCRTLAQTLDNF